MTVINTGANPATFVLDASTVHGSQELTVTLEQDVVSLAAGETAVISVHLSLDGSALNGEVFHVALTATSSLDSAVSDAVIQSVVYRSQQVTLVLDADATNVEAGGTVSGTLRLSTRVDDRLSLSASGATCNLPGPMNLSGSSEPLAWSCTIAEGASAGLLALNVSVRSAIGALGADVVASDAVVVTVLASWSRQAPSRWWSKTTPSRSRPAAHPRPWSGSPTRPTLWLRANWNLQVRTLPTSRPLGSGSERGSNEQFLARARGVGPLHPRDGSFDHERVNGGT